MRRVLLDTSAYSLLMRGQTEVAGLLDAADEVSLPAVVPPSGNPTPLRGRREVRKPRGD